MYHISITKKVENKDRSVFRVGVSKNTDTYDYTVTVKTDYYAKLCKKTGTMEDLVKKSFKFLLDREPPEAILKSFDLSVIQMYFPDYEETIKTY